MSVLEWKRFNFFDLVLCADHGKFRNIKAQIVGQCYNETQKVFCDALGFVYVFFKNWESISFQTHCNNIRLCAITAEKNLLVILAQHEPKDDVFVQIFNLNKIAKRNGGHSLGTARLLPLGAVKVLQACVLDNAQVCVAIGFDRGDILLHRAIVNRDMSANFRCIPVCPRPITGIEFRRKNPVNMFVCSDIGIFCYTITENNTICETKVILDANASPARCCALGPSPESYFLVGRDDAVYCFTSDGRGPCYAIEGRKQAVAWYGNNLVTLVQPEAKTFPHQTSSTLIVIDIQNKITVFSREVPSTLSVIVNGSNCFILMRESEVFQLQERDLQSKINLLIGKNLYDIALRLLADSDHSVYRGPVLVQYGDYLLQRGDLRGAIDKYIRTVGLVDPYCIIRKLLDSRYNAYLAEYLRALIKTEFATSEHLELLLNCDERLNLPSKVDHICYDSVSLIDIPLGCAESRMFPNMNTFQFLNKLRSGCEHMHDFLSKLTEEEVYDLFMENGQLLMTHYPTETTETLKLLCTKDSCSGTAVVKCSERFIPLLIANEEYCVEFLEHITVAGDCHVTVYTILLELYLRGWRERRRPAEDILKFMEKNIGYMSAEQLLVHCRSSSFWSGVLCLYKSCNHQQLCLRHYIKTCDLENALARNEYRDAENPGIWLQAFSRVAFSTENPVELINSVFKTMLEEKWQPLLQILQTISINKKLVILHIREFFIQEQLHTVSEAKEDAAFLKLLLNDQQNHDVLLSNFKQNPIEFRSRMCDICKQQLQLPAVYYLCQHCFHKECINAYSEENVCVACSAIRKQNNALEHVQNSDIVESLPSNACADIMGSISTLLSRRISKKFVGDVAGTIGNEHQADKFSEMPNVTKHTTILDNSWAGRFSSTRSPRGCQILTKIPISTNPFEDVTEGISNKNNYDNNLNPFND